jgi:predicted dithiol-disulfide oxidoreductase (DUF899 family)
MSLPKIVSREEWLAARLALLAKEKEFSKARDAIAAERRKMPVVKVESKYVFDAPGGKTSLRDLFGAKHQLIVYHFMFDPSWTDGCKSCSFVSDHVDGSLVHLAARDVAFAAVSRAPLARIEPFKKRMGWKFPWVSSFESDFNYDFGVSFRPEDKGAGKAGYNYGKGSFPTSEAPGLSTFLREGDDVFHAYSTYARGLDILIGAYNYLDLTPLGRHEEDLKYGMEWVRLHDKYD